jgi:Arc/MetJ family transcription regulator
MSMRTTIDLSDELLRLAKRRAVDEGTTLKAVFEDALRRYLEPRRPRSGYRLSWRVESGRLQPGVDLDDRDALFDLMDGRP